MIIVRGFKAVIRFIGAFFKEWHRLVFIDKTPSPDQDVW